MREAPDTIRLILDFNLSLAAVQAALQTPEGAAELQKNVTEFLWAQVDSRLASLPEKLEEYVNGDDEPECAPV